MKRNRWWVIALTLLTPAATNAQALPTEVRTAWEKAGFESGWLSRDSARFSFRIGESRAEELPAFRGERWPPGVMAKLPTPTQPFGLVCRGDFTDARLTEITAHKQLSELDLSLTRISDAGLADLARLPNLQVLDLRWNPAVTNAAIKELAAVKSLQALYVDATNATEDELAGLTSSLPYAARRCKITGAGLKDVRSLKQLQALHLLYLQIADADYRHLADLQAMQSLTLLGAKFTSGAGCKELGELKRLHTVNFLFAQVNGNGLHELTRLKALRSLSFYYTPVTDTELRALEDLDNLQSLRLSGTAVTGKGLKELGRLQQLRALYLDRSQWTDAGCAEIAWLKNLHTLDLADTRITDKGLRELATLKHLRFLDLRKSRVSPDGVAQLGAALPLVRIEH